MKKDSAEILLQKCNVNIKRAKRISLPIKSQLLMILNYISIKISEQIKSVLFIIFYLLAFQIVVLNTLPENAMQISLGVGLVVVGLTFFIEGLFLGLMPLGDKVGVRLPQKASLLAIMLFAFFLGVGSTLAEPAIASLRVAGYGVTPWHAPLLYRLLEIDSDALVKTVGSGVGVAIAIALLRIYYGLSMRLFLLIIAPVSVALTAACSFDENLKTIVGLAWDTGAVTTGAVTVPLILALGIGVSRSLNKRESATSGLGSVAFASIFPVIGVILLAFALNNSTMNPMPEEDFFSSSNREEVLKLVGDEDTLLKLAFQRGSDAARRLMFDSQSEYKKAIVSLNNADKRRNLLGNMSMTDWLLHHASDDEHKLILSNRSPEFVSTSTENIAEVDEVLVSELIQALWSVVPLVLLLMLVLLYLKDRPKFFDEVLLGIIFAIVGMTALTSGMQLGLTPLGDQAGRPLPRLFRSEAAEIGRIIINDFDKTTLFTIYDQKGVASKYFHLKTADNKIVIARFNESGYDSQRGIYEHIVEQEPIFVENLSLLGIFLVLLFAFGLGYGSTMAEPALIALGKTVEDLTVGTIKGAGVVKSVSIGVGIGLVIGVTRILYGLNTIWLIVTAYSLLIIITYFSDEEFTGVAWDCGGVTTGAITVPLVLAMGLGISNEAKIADGFGVLAMASVFPIIAVSLYGLHVKAKQNITEKDIMEAENA